jgi:alpha-1,3/alpha-1,6-mannosyltransferase
VILVFCTRTRSLSRVLFSNILHKGYGIAPVGCETFLVVYRLKMTNPQKKRHVVFIHLDLGIGGAEQLVLNLAAASQDLGHDITIVTSQCSQNHCFSQVQKPNGRLCHQVVVWGRFLPSNWMGLGTAFFSSLRMLYLSYWTAKKFGSTADCIVLDVLPTSIPFLISWVRCGILFYCHFPDKLLTRDTVNGEISDASLRNRSSLRLWYRHFLDSIEENTMRYADILCVNSKFTKSQVQQEFPSLSDKHMHVLYPALDMDKFSPPVFITPTNVSPVVSLNRFERKKNIELLLQAYALLLQKIPNSISHPLIIAGGYDVRSLENVEYLQELRKLARDLSIDTRIQFRPNISDTERAELLQTALCIVYTPHLEHFGIVPLESMYAGRPVLAVKSGGPMETIIDGKTGFLCHNTPQAFADALSQLIQNPTMAVAMGKAGHEHVKRTFGLERFQKEWLTVVTDTIEAGRKRQINHQRHYSIYNALYYVYEAMLVFCFSILLTTFLRWVGLLEANQEILGRIRNL